MVVEPPAFDVPVVRVRRVVEAGEVDRPPPHLCRWFPTPRPDKLIHRGAEPVGQRIGIRRPLHHLLQPQLRLCPLLGAIQIYADPGGEVTTDGPSDSLGKAAAEQRPTTLNELVELSPRQRPADHITTLQRR